ncbi:MAG: hypothetical protein KTR30_03210 [Saprospiraceae bacterium]|nr:hypothetical protein [Saprospiraceae bacterium]
MRIEIEPMPFFDQRKRLDQLQLLARQEQIPFSKNHKFKDWQTGLPSFKLWKNKSRRKIKNIFQFSEPSLGGHIQIFDFLYMDDDGETRRTTTFLFESKDLRLPSFRIKPKGFEDLLGKLFVTRSPLFPQYPEFSKNYKIIGRDRTAIQYAIKPEIFSLFTGKHNWHLEGEGHFLIWYRKNKTRRTTQIMSFYEEGRELCHWMLNSDTNDYV